jgi:hypothetical protein
LKLIISALLILFLALTGCNNDYAGDTEKQTTEEKKDDGDTKTEDKDTDKEEPKLEIIDQSGGTWKDSIDTVWVHSAAVFKNTGNVPINISDSQLNYKAQDGSVLGTSTTVYAIPSIVNPGETAFIGESTILEGVTDPATYKETTYNFGFDPTDEDPNMLETSGVKGIKGDEYTPYKVTGMVKNTTDQKQDDIRIAAGLFDANGKILGVFTGSVDVGVNSGGEAGFELSYPEVPRNIVDKISKVEVKAYGWNW